MTVCWIKDAAAAAGCFGFVFFLNKNGQGFFLFCDCDYNNHASVHFLQPLVLEYTATTNDDHFKK